MVTLIIVIKLLQIIERKTSNSKKIYIFIIQKGKYYWYTNFQYKKKKKKIDISISMWYAFVWTLTKKAHHYRAANRSLIR